MSGGFQGIDCMDDPGCTADGGYAFSAQEESSGTSYQEYIIGRVVVRLLDSNRWPAEPVARLSCIDDRVRLSWHRIGGSYGWDAERGLPIWQAERGLPIWQAERGIPIWQVERFFFEYESAPSEPWPNLKYRVFLQRSSSYYEVRQLGFRGGEVPRSVWGRWRDGVMT